MNQTLARLEQLRYVLLRLGVRQAGRFWANEPRVFASNLLGGAVTGAIAFIIGAFLLGIDVRRGENSLLVHFVRAIQGIVDVFRTMFERELQ